MLAAIDAGSNTLRLLVGRVIEGKVVPKYYLRRISRLAGGFSQEEGLSPAARERTLSALQAFAEACHQDSVRQIKAIGTAAFRQACNGPSFARDIRAVTLLPFEIISGEEEAAHMARGVLSALDPVPPCALIFDIGGGSTEFVLCANHEVIWSSSVSLGVVRLAETCTSPERVCAATEEVMAGLKADLASACHSAGLDLAGLTLVGTAGTVTTLAALEMHMTEYDWRRVNNCVLPLSRLQYWQNRLAPMSPAAREALPGMEPGRGDLIPVGLEIILCLMRHLQAKTLKVSDFGLLEGLLISLQNSGKS